MQKITPFLWFNTEAQAAMEFYTSLFPQSQILNTSPGPDGQVMTGTFSLSDYQFMALNGGAQFKFTPAISFFVNTPDAAQLQNLWDKLIEGGHALMALDTYPFSEKYGWLEDRYNLSWQISLAPTPKLTITPSLLFVGNQNGRATQAISFYTSIFPNSSIGKPSYYPPDQNPATGSVNYAPFTLHNQDFIAMDGGLDHDFNFSEAISFFVSCTNQKEIDFYWDKLSAQGEIQPCGWLKDQFGVSWQIIPNRLGELLQNSDPQKSKRVMQAMLQMKKIDFALLEKATNNV